VLLLVACNGEEASPELESKEETENIEQSAETTPAVVTDTESESEETATTGESALESEIEQYIDGMVNWTSFEVKGDLTVDYASEDDIDEEYHHEVKFVAEPLQIHRLTHSISFSNSHFEVYATENEAYNNDGIDEWIEVNVGDVDFTNPIDRRMSLLNTVISSTGAVEAENLIYKKTIDANDQQAVMNELYLAFFGIPLDETITLSSVEVMVTVNEERITQLYVNATATTDTSQQFEMAMSEMYENVNSFTEIPSPVQ
jgi:hypothetical protein